MVNAHLPTGGGASHVRRMKRKLYAAVLAVLLIAASLGAYRIVKRRHAADEFGRPASLHPGSGSASADPSAKLENPLQRESLPEYQDVPAATTDELTPAIATDENRENWLRSQGDRSEERRVGKECRSRWSPDH